MNGFKVTKYFNNLPTYSPASFDNCGDDKVVSAWAEELSTKHDKSISSSTLSRAEMFGNSGKDALASSTAICSLKDQSEIEVGDSMGGKDGVLHPVVASSAKVTDF